MLTKLIARRRSSRRIRRISRTQSGQSLSYHTVTWGGEDIDGARNNSGSSPVGLKILRGKIPVDKLAEESIDVRIALVLVIEVIRVLPYIERQ